MLTNVQTVPTAVMQMLSAQTLEKATNVNATMGIPEMGLSAVTLMNVPLTLMIAMKELNALIQKEATLVNVQMGGLGMAKFVKLRVQLHRPAKRHHEGLRKDQHRVR